MAAKSRRTPLRRPARRVVVLAALSVATFACSPQASDAPATAEAPATAAAAREPGDLTPLEGFTVEGEVGDGSTSDHGVRSWVEVDAELDGDLVPAPPDQPTEVRPVSPVPRPAVPTPRPTGRSSSSPTAGPVRPSPTTQVPTTSPPTTTAPTTPAPDSTTSTPPAPDLTTTLASADAIIATALEDGLITAGTAVALSAKVDTASAALATGGPVTSTCGAIGALLGLLSAQYDKDIPAVVADQLIAAALAASAALAC